MAVTVPSHGPGKIAAAQFIGLEEAGDPARDWWNVRRVRERAGPRRQHCKDHRRNIQRGERADDHRAGQLDAKRNTIQQQVEKRHTKNRDEREKQHEQIAAIHIGAVAFRVRADQRHGKDRDRKRSQQHAAQPSRIVSTKAIQQTNAKEKHQKVGTD